MKTPWGEIAVSDSHVHFFSHSLFGTLARQRGEATQDSISTLGFDAPDENPADFASRWVDELDRHGVSTAALIASVPGDESSVAAAIRRYPDRFHGYFMLDPTSPGAPERVVAAVEAGLQGVCLFPAMHRYSLSDERVSAVLDAIAQRPDTVVFIHCGVLSVGIRTKLGLPSRFDMRFSNPIDVHPVALQYSQLKFVIPHFGAGFFREALMVADLCPNIYFDTSSSNSWVKYQMPLLDLRDVFRRSLDLLGSHRLLFGTDSSHFPRGWQRQVLDVQMNVLFDLGVGTDEAALILGGNLRRILSR